MSAPTPAPSKRWIAIPDWLLFLGVAIIAGTLDVWLLIGWREINPLSLGWLSGDPSQYEAGWEFLRHEPGWRFPLTWLSRLDYPMGVSASNLDIIPLVGVFLRPIAFLLPQNFQYLGLYAVVCFILQAYFGFKLTSCFSHNDRTVALLGGLFLLVAPILTIRIGAHFPQLSQWIIIAGLYYYFRYSNTLSIHRLAMPFVILAMIGAGITPYIALMAVLLGISAITRAWLERRGRPRDEPDASALTSSASASGMARLFRNLRKHFSLNCILWVLALLVGTGLSLTVFGFITLGPESQFAGSGYTHYSMNLLAPINPGGDALYFKNLPILPGQYEGYNYLGIGVLVLGLISIARQPALLKGFWAKPVRPLLVMSILLTVLALSAKVTFGQAVLFTIPLPRFVFHLLAAYRSSGRLFWPVHYLLALAAIAGTIATIPSRAARRLILAGTLALQSFDLLPMREYIADEARAAHQNPLLASDWAAIPRQHRHLVILPALQCDSSSPGGYVTWARFALLAARSGMTLNSAYLGRVSPHTHDFDCLAVPETLLSEGPRRDTAYVLRDDFALRVAASPARTHFCRRVNGFNLCTYDPVRVNQSSLLGRQILPLYSLGTVFRAESAAPPSMFLQNINSTLGEGRWTVGREAFVYLRPALPLSGDLRLEMGFARSGGLLTAQHRRQLAIVKVDGRTIGSLELSLNGSNSSRVLNIPRVFVHEGEITTLEFELPDAAAPSKLGINDDDRLLALYISRLRIVPAD